MLLGNQAHAAQTVVTDVCVYGGGAGGVAAAVQASRMGKSVALIAFNNHLGGMTSAGLSTTDIGGNGDAYIQGIAREFYTRVGAIYGGTTADYIFEPHVAEEVFDNMVQEAGVAVYFNGQLAATGMNGTQIVQITMVNGDVFKAKEFIDATYEGDLLKQAGVSYTTGREAASQYGESLAGVRPIGSGYQVPDGVDPYVVAGDPASGLLPPVNATAGGPVGAADASIPAYCYRLCLTTRASDRVAIAQPPGYDPANYELLFRAIAAGETTGFWGQSEEPDAKIDATDVGGVSVDLIGMEDAYPEADYATRAQIALATENWERGLIWAIQNDPRVPAAIRKAWAPWGLAADEFTDTNNWPPQLYVREARRMISDYVMTQGNCMGNFIPGDPIGLAADDVDSHATQRIVTASGVKNEGILSGGVQFPYPISYRAIVPKTGECPNLLVPWCVSASHVAFSSIRMEPVYMILGQAAGTAACFAIDDGVSVQAVSYPKLAAQLQSEGQALAAVPATTGIIVDNTDPTAVVETGTWTLSSATPGYFGLNYLQDGNADKGAKSVAFTPALPSAGDYTVYLRWTANSDHSAATPVDIVNATGTSTVMVNQQENGGQWIPLGTFPFQSGTSGSVVVRNTNTTGYVIADAVSFAPAPSSPIVSLWASNAQAAAVSGTAGAPLAGTITVSRQGPTSSPLEVDLSVGGTALPGADYAALPGSVTIPSGESSVTFPVNPVADSLSAVDTTVTVQAAAAGGYAPGALNGATVVIHANPPVPAIIGNLEATGSAGQQFSYQVAATRHPKSYGAVGLPAGLSIQSATGLISGTAITPGDYTVTVIAKNGSGAAAASLNLNILGSFAAWQRQWFTAPELANPAISGGAATPAGDGIANLLKYALNLPPAKNGSGEMPVASVTSFDGNSYLTLTYTCSAIAADVDYIVEVSNDMQTWYSGDGCTLTLSEVANPGGLTNTCTVEDVAPMGATPQFMRLRVTRP